MGKLARVDDSVAKSKHDGFSAEEWKQYQSALAQELTRELGDFSGKLLQEVRALSADRTQLERLGRIDDAASALEQLDREYTRRKQQMADELRLAERANEERQTELERGWREREADLQDRERETERKLRDAAIARRESEARLEHEVLALQKDIESERRVAEMRIRGLVEAVDRQRAQISAMETQLNEARQQVRAITVKAIEAAGAARASEVAGGAPKPGREDAEDVKALRSQFVELHASMAADLQEFETSMKAQGAVVESTRMAMAQTDDLVERVVEALEAMQSAVLGDSEDRVVIVR